MNKVSSSFIAPLLLSATIGYGQSEGKEGATLPSGVKPTAKETTQEVAPQVEAAKLGANNLSAAARADHKFGVGLGLGSFLLPVSGAGLSMHYNMSSAVQFEAASYDGSMDVKDELASSLIIRLDKADLKASYTYVGAKFFPGNSFYIAGGLGYRTLVFDFTMRSALSQEFVAEKITANSVVGRLAIGNTWSFDSGFYIGGEWVGIAAPVSSSTKSEVKTNFSTTDPAETTAFDTVKKSAQDTADKLGKITSFNLLLNLGWQF